MAFGANRRFLLCRNAIRPPWRRLYPADRNPSMQTKASDLATGVFWSGYWSCRCQSYYSRFSDRASSTPAVPISLDRSPWWIRPALSVRNCARRSLPGLSRRAGRRLWRTARHPVSWVSWPFPVFPSSRGRPATHSRTTKTGSFSPCIRRSVTWHSSLFTPMPLNAAREIPSTDPMTCTSHPGWMRARRPSLLAECGRRW
jgi:hypothetical protein